LEKYEMREIGRKEARETAGLPSLRIGIMVAGSKRGKGMRRPRLVEKGKRWETKIVWLKNVDSQGRSYLVEEN